MAKRKKASGVWVVCILATVFASQAAADRSADIKDVCTDLVLDYAYYRDRPEPEQLGRLFTKDATLMVMGQAFKGRSEIEKRVRDARDGPVFRHMMSTIRIFVLDADHARGISYVTVYSAPPGEGPRPLQDPVAVGEYHDQFVRTEHGWQIAQREFVAVYLP